MPFRAGDAEARFPKGAVTITNGGPMGRWVLWASSNGGSEPDPKKPYLARFEVSSWFINWISGAQGTGEDFKPPDEAPEMHRKY